MLFEKKILALCVALAICNICFGQKDSDRVIPKVKRIYILKFNDRPPLITQFAYVDPSLISGINAFSRSASEEFVSTLKVDEVIIFSLKSQYNLLTIYDVLNLYNIKSPKKKWILKVDDDTVSYPQTLIVSRNQIKNVICGNGYVHIILKDYYELKEKYKKAKIIYN